MSPKDGAVVEYLSRPLLEEDEEVLRPAQAEILRLAERKGGVTAEDVLDVARDPSSSLHPYFTWDDTVAAEKYRLEQARSLIRRVKVRIVDDDPEKPIITRAVVHVRSKDAYMTVEGVLSNRETRAELLDRALRDYESLERKYSHLEELSELFISSRLRVKLFRDAR